MTSNRTSLFFLAFLAALVFCLGLIVIRPLLKPILFALVLAMVFHPIHAWIRKRIRLANAAALVSTTLVFLVLIAPAMLLVRTIAAELRALYLALNGQGPAGMNEALSWIGRAERWINEVVRHSGFTSFDIRSAIRVQIGEGSGWLLQQGAGLLGNISGLLLGAVVAALTLFFLFRDGASLRERATSMLPLAAGHVERLFNGVHDVVIASIYGVFAVSLLQGLLVGLAFWSLDVSSPVFWAAVTAVLSLIPIVGTGAVWVPAAVLLMADGHWGKSLILAAWGSFIVHPVDNILRPYLVGQRARLNAIYLFFAILGGVKAFGLIGLLAGPVILSVGIVLYDILRSELSGRDSVTASEPHPTAPQNHDRDLAATVRTA